MQPEKRTDIDPDLRGKWTVTTSSDADGEPKGEVELLLSDRSFTRKRGDVVVSRMELLLDRAQSPRTIDATVLAGKDKGKTLKGIYKIEDDTLTLVYARPGDPRPDGFPNGSTTQLTVYVARRVKPTQ